ncbi:hypothetical protein IC582_000234 [Cucumis melo]|uniref:Uncharacterized protein LOC103495399 n=1 Tax=Cucumis melo TaxID=3656 RepID=A0A1S3C099_CUCME|nr:uncharacterized protein LOC103495399 [Cucumis melo]
MSSKFGHWRTMLLQLFRKTDNSSSTDVALHRPRRRVSEPLQGSSSVAMVVPFGSTTYLSSLLRSYYGRPRMRPQKQEIKDHRPSSSTFFFFPAWAKWIFGTLLSLLVPNWNKLQRIEDEAEMVMEEVENVAEVVEKVAELTEKVSTEISEKLPEKSKLKEAAQVVENYSKEIAHDAHLTQDILHKVEEWKQKIDKSKIDMNESNKERNKAN